jgi:hypothetical protein
MTHRRRILPRPRVFLSYAHEDAQLVSLVQQALGDSFDVFLDAERIRAGENFAQKIRDELRRVDAVVALLTPASVASAWCQAELHHAHAMRKRVVPIRVGDDTLRESPPLAQVHREIHHLATRDATGMESLLPRLARDLASIRADARWRVLARAATVAVIAAALSAAALALVGRLNAIQAARERSSAVSRLAAAAQPLPRAELDVQTARLAHDREYWKETLALASDAQLSDATRLSAAMAAARIAATRNPGRWVIEGVAWRGERTRSGRLVDVTFASGALTDLTFEDYTFAGLVWNSAATDTRAGLTLAKTHFRHSKFDFSWFAGTNAIDVEFENCAFRGSVLDVTNFSLVRVFSRSAEKRPGVITDEVAVVENSVVLNRGHPAAPGVLDLGDPRQQVTFEDVVFEATHFRGFIRPEWFRNCSFRYCVLPVGLSVKALEARGNALVGSYAADEALD